MGWPCGEIYRWGRAALLLLAAGAGGGGGSGAGSLGGSGRCPLAGSFLVAGGSGAGVAGRVSEAVGGSRRSLGPHTHPRVGGDPSAPGERGRPSRSGWSGALLGGGLGLLGPVVSALPSLSSGNLLSPWFGRSARATDTWGCRLPGRFASETSARRSDLLCHLLPEGHGHVIAAHAEFTTSTAGCFPVRDWLSCFRWRLPTFNHELLKCSVLRSSDVFLDFFFFA